MGNIIFFVSIIMTVSVAAHVVVKSKNCLHNQEFTIEDDTIKIK